MLNDLFEKNKNLTHLVFLFILSLNYLIPLLIFGKITLFYHDTLDSEIVYNYVIGKYYSGDEKALNLFINGEINLDFLRRIYQPLIILYVLFDTELAYWLTDLIVKLVSYFSFYLLAKKINGNILVSALLACLFASINIPTHNGLGVAIFPYIVYLCLRDKEISIWNYLILILAGLNSDLVFTVFALPFLIILVFILFKNKSNFYEIKNIKIISVFFIFLLISNINLIYLPLGEYSIHRQEFVKYPIPYSNLFFAFFNALFTLSYEINYAFINNLPTIIFLPVLFFLAILSKHPSSLKILAIILSIQIFLVFLKTEFYLGFYNNSKGIISSLSLDYCSTILPFLYCLIAIIIMSKKNYLNNFFRYLIIFVILLSQFNSSIVPIYKKYILDGSNYRNIYTFEEYYLYDDYKKFKKIVNNKRVLSIGIDPMVAVMNDIATIDGYHNIYPLHYKYKFRKVIEKELESNIEVRKYFDGWGSRLYTFSNDASKILIDFNEAKKLGAEYVISKHDLISNGLKLICDDCSSYVKLYFIQ